MTMTACDRGLRGACDRGVDLLPPTVRTQRDKEPANKTVMTLERSHVLTHTYTHLYLNTCEDSQ